MLQKFESKINNEINEIHRWRWKRRERETSNKLQRLDTLYYIIQFTTENWKKLEIVQIGKCAVWEKRERENNFRVGITWG